MNKHASRNTGASTSFENRIQRPSATKESGQISERNISSKATNRGFSPAGSNPGQQIITPYPNGSTKRAPIGAAIIAKRQSNDVQDAQQGQEPGRFINQEIISGQQPDDAQSQSQITISATEIGNE